MSRTHYASLLAGIIAIAVICLAVATMSSEEQGAPTPPDADEIIDDSLVKVTKVIFDSKDPLASTLSLTAGTRVHVSVDAEMDCASWRMNIPVGKKSPPSSPSSADRPLPSFEVKFVRRSSGPTGEEGFVTGGSKPRAIDARHVRWDGKSLVPNIPGQWRVRLVFVEISGPRRNPEYSRYTVAAFDVTVEEAPEQHD